MRPAKSIGAGLAVKAVAFEDVKAVAFEDVTANLIPEVMRAIEPFALVGCWEALHAEPVGDDERMAISFFGGSRSYHPPELNVGAVRRIWSLLDKLEHNLSREVTSAENAALNHYTQ